MNLKKYGQTTPPKIEVESLSKVPIYFFSGKYDRITHVDDNRRYASLIPTVKEHIELEGDHFTFLIGKDMEWFNKVTHILKNHSSVANELDADEKKSSERGESTRST